MTAPTTAPTLSAERYQQVLLARLGLPASASSEDIEAAHYAVTSYLAKAPRELKDWARRQAAEVDEAYAILIDPTALADPAALVGPGTRSVAVPGGPATPPARRGSSPKDTKAASAAAAAAAASAPTTTAATDAERTFEEMLAEVTPTAHRDTVPGTHATPAPAALPAQTATSGRGGRRAMLIGAAAVALIAVAGVGYSLGANGSGVGGDQAAASAQPSSAPASTAPALDTATVATLMDKLQANPKDTETLMGLADAYYAAEDWTTAESWLDKLLAIDATNVRALLAKGAVAFNTGDLGGAKTAWEQVVAVEPDNVEAHYDLGFMYLNQSPPDMDGLQREWGKVIEIAPDSDVAQTVKAHLDALVSPAPSAGASETPSSAPSAAPSAAPSGSTQP